MMWKYLQISYHIAVFVENDSYFSPHNFQNPVLSFIHAWVKHQALEVIYVGVLNSFASDSSSIKVFLPLKDNMKFKFIR